MKANFIVTATLVLLSLTACNLPAESRPDLGFPTATLPATIEPLPVITEFLSNATIVSYDPFDSMRNWTFHDSTGTLTDGGFEQRGAARWQGSFWLKKQFKEGQGLSLRFKVQRANAQSEFVFVTGEWLTDSFRQFGVYNAVVPKGDLFQGTKDLGGYDLKGNLNILSDTWYDLLLAVGSNGHFLAVVWDLNDKTRRAVYDLAGGADWAGRTWVFLPKANEGETLFVDDFYRISFGDIK
jgi:hypothetical protein